MLMYVMKRLLPFETNCESNIEAVKFSLMVKHMKLQTIDAE